MSKKPNEGLIQVVVGGQFGSEGKGAVVAHLGKTARATNLPRATMRVAGPNAGHTVIDPHGSAWPLRSVPVTAVVDPDAVLLIGPGSEIDRDLLEQEISQLEEAGFLVRDRLVVDREATVLSPERHQTTEATAALTARLGSTGKGIGAARADRAMRTAELYGGHGEATAAARRVLERRGIVIIEGTQGYGLGLHAGYYPYCTSSDCRAVDFLAMAGLSPWSDGVRLEVVMAVRPYPIRVAGNSGPLLGETTWEELGLFPEKTTVTRKVRRVGVWDPGLVERAVRDNGGTVKLALTMADHVWPELSGHSGQVHWEHLPERARKWLSTQSAAAGAPFAYLGTGPGSMMEIKP